MKKEVCPHCNGTGEEPFEEGNLSCSNCNGMGEIYDDNEVQK